MPADPRKLNDLTLAAIRTATDALAAGGSVNAWQDAMRTALTRAHTAAYIAATADRLGVTPSAALVSPARLSRAERAELKAAVNTQLTYLAGFARDLPTMSDAQIAARAALYAGATRGTYYATRYPRLPFYPADGGTACKANCRCAWTDNGDGTYTYQLGAAEHCPGCQARAAGSPYRPEAA